MAFGFLLLVLLWSVAGAAPALPIPHASREAGPVREHLEDWPNDPDLAPPKPLELHASEALALGMLHNLDLWVGELEPEVAATQIRLAEGLFDPLVRGIVSRGGLSEIFATDLNQVLGYRQQLLTRWGFEQTTPLGVRYSLEYRTGQDQLSQAAQGLGSLTTSVQSTFFSLVVPLLRGLGTDVQLGPVRAAELRQQRAQKMYAELTLETATQIQKTYWQLVGNRRQLSVQLRAQRRAQHLLHLLEEQIEAGRAAAYESYEARQNLALIETDLTELRRAIMLQEQALLNALGLDPLVGRVLPLDPMPSPGEAGQSLEGWVEQALRQRPELEAAQLEIRALEAERVTLVNQLLPQLDLVGDYRINRGSSFLGREAWQLSLQFSFPLGNNGALARVQRNELLLEQARRRAQRSQQQVVLDTSLAYRSMGIQRERWLRAQTARHFALLRTEAEQERFQVGFTPAHRVVFAQQYEVISLQKAVQAELDFQLARLDLERSVGSGLDELLKLRASESAAESREP